MTRKPSTTSSRRGVALVVTLGLLAVLILMAVAFAISMRVERIAARNYADVVQARQWAQSALSIAIADAETRIGNQVMMPASDNNVLINTAGATAINPALFSGAVTNYLPTSLHTDILNKTSRWQNVSQSHPGGGPVARIAYQIVDCTGFIDANLGGGIIYPNRRGIATNAMDMIFDTSVTADVTDRTFPTRLIDWKPLTSLADFWILAGPSGANALNKTDNFFTYSRFPPGYANSSLILNRTLSTNLPPVFLGYSQTDFDTKKAAIKEEIKAQLQTMPGIGAYASVLAANFVDFCDSDHLPEGTPTERRNEFAMDSTPLINEFLLELTPQSAGSGQFQLQCRASMEVWFPFVGITNKESYEAQVVIRFRNDPSSSYSSFTVTYPKTAFATPVGGWKYNDYLKISIPVAVSGTASSPPDPTKITAEITAAIFQTGNAMDVDAVVAKSIKLVNLNPAVGALSTAGIAIDDPRFNATALGKWYETGTAVNQATTPVPATAQTLLAGAAPNTPVWTHDTATDSDFRDLGLPAPWIYWPGRVIQTTGELGLQAYNPAKAWHTIPLLGTTAAQIPILDRFYVRTNMQGMININTRRAPVLQTAFNGCPKNGYPGQNTTKISGPGPGTDLANIVSAIQAVTSTSPLKNLSDLSQISATVLGPNTQLESEGVIRDTAEILGVRQNLFTILFAAQSLSDTGNVLGEQRGIAVVWRDPYADSTGYHPSFVRYLRWLPD